MFEFVWAEDYIYRSGGTFVFVALNHAAPAPYLEAAGSIGAIFSARYGMAAATGELLLFRAGIDTAPDEALRAAFDVARGWWGAAGLSAYAGIDRLMTKHNLSLSAFNQRRRWSAARFPVDDANVVLEQLCVSIAATCAPIVAAGSCNPDRRE